MLPLLLALIGCSGHPKVGTIVDKHIRPPWTQMVPMTISCGKGCTTTSFIPIYHGETYVITLQGCDGGGCYQWQDDVSASDWSGYEAGDTVAER